MFKFVTVVESTAIVKFVAVVESMAVVKSTAVVESIAAVKCVMLSIRVGLILDMGGHWV